MYSFLVYTFVITHTFQFCVALDKCVSKKTFVTVHGDAILHRSKLGKTPKKPNFQDRIYLWYIHALKYYIKPRCIHSICLMQMNIQKIMLFKKIRQNIMVYFASNKIFQRSETQLCCFGILSCKRQQDSWSTTLLFSV